MIVSPVGTVEPPAFGRPYGTCWCEFVFFRSPSSELLGDFQMPLRGTTVLLPFSSPASTPGSGL